MSTVKFVIPGDPCAKQRPRMTRAGHTYIPKKTVNYETLVKTIYANKCGEYFDGPVEIKVMAYFAIPKSAGKKKKEDMLAGRIRPTKRPDGDNLLKIIADSLNKIAYDDDSQVVSATVDKLYAEQSRVEVTIREIGGEKVDMGQKDCRPY